LIDGRAVSRFDVRVLAGGIVASAALAVGGGFLLADLNRPAGDLGPTAATLTDAWNVAAGAGLGLFAGSALVAVLARRGSRVPTAIATSGTACLAVVIGFSVANAPADDTLGDQVTFIVLASFVELAPVLLGAMIGAFAAGILDGYRGRLSATR
jgi:hypothetical protein